MPFLAAVPGIFLVALQDQLIYYSAVDETFFNNNFQIGNQMNLADLSTPIIGKSTILFQNKMPFA